ncbi:DUF3703 domain-containing protein [Chitinivorax sp. B]|uniref:DUF3703 domain-containing protein n=1 Tax=Chitinivorax sp. B TaxID=2502235 RepID=UPI0020173CE3|nr:DUF3703 domain-containing protein [Chitinivorax sp. B]
MKQLTHGFRAMPMKLGTAFDAEMTAGKQAYGLQQFDVAFSHLERAHILGQRYVWPHIISHVWMLRIGLQRRDRREVVGQVIRIVGGGLGSAIGRVPIGNTGGANVSPFMPMPIPEDLQRYFD